MLTRSQKGVTLIELMIVVVILAILASIAYPAYTNYVLRSRRGEAKTVVLDLAMRQERWRASHTSYGAIGDLLTLAPPIANPSDAYYTYTVASAANTFTITATPQGSQAADGCTLTVDQSGTKNPAACW